MQLYSSFAALLAVIPFAVAQSPVYGQCGGIGWAGPFTCVAGSTCVEFNPYFSHCVADTSSTPSSTGGGTRNLVRKPAYDGIVVALQS